MVSLNILLVEDNEGDILLTTEALEEAGFAKDIEVVKDGEAAISFLRMKVDTTVPDYPDLILLDVNLPKLNGHDVLRFIKSHSQLKHLPVVMFTTSSSDDDVLTAYNNYANCYITKPAEINNFNEVISSMQHFWANVARLPTKREF